jgi:hypothetical protein
MLQNDLLPSRYADDTHFSPALAARVRRAPRAATNRPSPPVPAAAPLTIGHPGQMLRQAQGLVMQQPPAARGCFLAGLIEQVKAVHPDWTAHRTLTRGGGTLWRGDYRNVLYVSPAGEVFQAPVLDGELLQAAQDDDVPAVRALVEALQGKVWPPL